MNLFILIGALYWGSGDVTWTYRWYWEPPQICTRNGQMVVCRNQERKPTKPVYNPPRLD